MVVIYDVIIVVSKSDLKNYNQKISKYAKKASSFFQIPQACMV